MCFSAPVSFMAGTALSAAGVVTIRRAKEKSALPVAAIPLLFGIQQIVEGFVWLSLRFDVAVLNAAATFFYSVFSHVFWPIFGPFAVLALETVPWRKKVIFVFQLIGIVAGIYLLYIVIKFPVVSSVVGGSILYDFPLLTFPAIPMYFFAIFGSCFFSSHKLVNLFGGLLLLSAVVAYWLYETWFISVWCFFAAMLSFLILY